MPVERTKLTIKYVKEIEQVGDKNLPRLTFQANDGKGDRWYYTFKQKVFDLIKVDAVVDCDVEHLIKDGVTAYRVIQAYKDGQPVVGAAKKRSYGKSTEELDQMARTMSLSYAKDLAIAGLINKDEIKTYAGDFYNWVKGKG